MKKILIVDDEEDILKMLKTALKRRGYTVAGSFSCDEGLDIFYSFRPDILIIDINVGSADGRVMCKQIKSQAEHRHIPVILISADSDNLKSYAEYGANAVMEKPFNMTRLVALLETI